MDRTASERRDALLARRAEVQDMIDQPNVSTLQLYRLACELSNIDDELSCLVFLHGDALDEA